MWILHDFTLLIMEQEALVKQILYLTSLPGQKIKNYISTLFKIGFSKTDYLHTSGKMQSYSSNIQEFLNLGDENEQNEPSTSSHVDRIHKQRIVLQTVANNSSISAQTNGTR